MGKIVYKSSQTLLGSIDQMDNLLRNLCTYRRFANVSVLSQGKESRREKGRREFFLTIVVILFCRLKGRKVFVFRQFMGLDTESRSPCSAALLPIQRRDLVFSFPRVSVLPKRTLKLENRTQNYAPFHFLLRRFRRRAEQPIVIGVS